MDAIRTAESRAALDRAYAEAILDTDPDDVHALQRLRRTWRDRANHLTGVQPGPPRPPGRRGSDDGIAPSLLRAPVRAAAPERRAPRTGGNAGLGFRILIGVVLVSFGTRMCGRLVNKTDFTPDPSFDGIFDEDEAAFVGLRSLVMPYADDAPPPTTGPELAGAVEILADFQETFRRWERESVVEGIVLDTNVGDAVSQLRELAPLLAAYEREGASVLVPRTDAAGAPDAHVLEAHLIIVLGRLDEIRVPAFLVRELRNEPGGG